MLAEKCCNMDVQNELANELTVENLLDDSRFLFFHDIFK